jgi:hypothetical protein
MTTATTTTVLIVGNTFPVKDQIKSLGGRWDAAAKGWRVPAAVAAKAQALVSGAVKGPYRAAQCPPVCVRCGGRLDAYTQRRGYRFCSRDCVNDAKLGGMSGYVNGAWHQGDDD